MDLRPAGLLSGLCRLLPLMLACLVPSTSSATPPRYAVVDLGLLPGYDTFAFATGINNRGDVVGEAHYYLYVPSYPPQVTNRWHGFLWRDGALRDIGTLGGQNSTAAAINDAGLVVGTSDTADARRLAFQWMNAPMTALPLLAGGSTSEAYDVNAMGWITGGASTAASGGNNHAVIWKNGPPQSLDPLKDDVGSSSYGYGINDQGDVVGAYSSGSVFIARHDDPAGLQAIPNVNGKADDINGSGQVAGYRIYGSPNNIGQPFLWQNGAYTPLPTLDGQYQYVATAVNASGDVVGGYSNEMSRMRAYLWSQGAYYDLNTLLVAGTGWTLLRANDINDLGQIVGEGDFAGTQHPFLLTPLLYGDVDGNVKVDLADVKATLRAAAGLVPARIPVAADVVPPAPASGTPGDGRIDIRDALRILRRIQNLEPSWP